MLLLQEAEGVSADKLQVQIKLIETYRLGTLLIALSCPGLAKTLECKMVVYTWCLLQWQAGSDIPYLHWVGKLLCKLVNPILIEDATLFSDS